MTFAVDLSSPTLEHLAFDTAHVGAVIAGVDARFEEEVMNAEQVRAKEIISYVTSLDPAEVDDRAAWVDDLQHDSLSLLEVGAPEGRFQELRTVQDSVELVMEPLAARETRLETTSA